MCVCLGVGVGVPVFHCYPPFSLFMLGLVMNQERDGAKMAATQNSPPVDLLGEIWGGGLALLRETNGEVKSRGYEFTPSTGYGRTGNIPGTLKQSGFLSFFFFLGVET